MAEAKRTTVQGTAAWTFGVVIFLIWLHRREPPATYTGHPAVRATPAENHYTVRTSSNGMGQLHLKGESKMSKCEVCGNHDLRREEVEKFFTSTDTMCWPSTFRRPFVCSTVKRPSMRRQPKVSAKCRTSGTSQPGRWRWISSRIENRRRSE